MNKLNLTEDEKRKIEDIYTARQDRVEHPEGKFDNAGRWYADDDSERCECCDHIRSPSRAYPFSEMTHCRTRKHITNLVLAERNNIQSKVA